MPALYEHFQHDYSRKNLNDTIAQARGLREGEVRTLYVQRYATQTGKGGLASPIIAIGDTPDAERPKGDPRANWNKYNTKPEVKERRSQTERTRRRNKVIEKNASKNVFHFMAVPIKPVVLSAIRVTKHVLEDDDEIPLGPSIRKPRTSSGSTPLST